MQVRYLVCQIEGGVVDGGHHYITRHHHGRTAYSLLTGAKGYFVNAAFGRLARLAKAGAHACHVLQL